MALPQDDTSTSRVVTKIHALVLYLRMEPLYIQEGEGRMDNDTDKVSVNGDPVNIVVWYDYI